MMIKIKQAAFMFWMCTQFMPQTVAWTGCKNEIICCIRLAASKICLLLNYWNHFRFIGGFEMEIILKNSIQTTSYEIIIKYFTDEQYCAHMRTQPKRIRSCKVFLHRKWEYNVRQILLICFVSIIFFQNNLLY